VPASPTTGIQVTKKKNSRLAILRLVITQAKELLPNSGTLGVFFFKGIIGELYLEPENSEILNSLF
jgi:hypothetical protein